MRGIYKIVNSVNNKFYVGSAVCMKRRKARHFSELRHNKHNNKHLQHAWNKYGEGAFTFLLVEKVAENKCLLQAENKWLKKHVGEPYCYNIGVDATAPMLGMKGVLSPTWGYKHTDEAKAKISACSKARIQSPEEKEKRRISKTGVPQTMEARMRISKALMGCKNHNYGKPRSQAFIQKVSKIIEASDSVGSITIYASISTAREVLNLKPATINRALKSGAPISKGKYKGWSFKYA